MKIVGLINHNNEGGAQHAMKKLAGCIADQGHSFSIIYLYGVMRESIVMQENVLQEQVLYPKKKLSVIGLPFVCHRLVKQLKREEAAAVICFLPLAAVIGSICAVICGIRTRIISQRNPASSYDSLMKFMDCIAGSTPLYTHNICNSHAVEKSFRKFPYLDAYQKKLSVVYNAVELNKSSETGSNWKSRLGIASDRRLLVSVGRLAEQKRHDLAIEIIAKIPDVHLAIAGHGELEGLLRKLSETLGCSKRVHFLGKLVHSEIYGLLKGADIFLQASSYEGQSNALLEALAGGSVIVCSNIQAHSEVLICRGGPAGVLIQGWRTEDWIEALECLFKCGNVQRALSKLAAQRSQDFSAENMCDGFLSKVTENEQYR